MRAREAIRIIKREILPFFPGFTMTHAAEMMIVPMNHLFRRFSFSPSSSITNTAFKLNVDIMPLYFPTDFTYLLFGKLLRNNSYEDWDFSEPDVFSRVIAVMKGEGMDVLNTASGPLELALHGPRLVNTTEAKERTAYSFAYAERFDESLRLIEEVASRYEASEPKYDTTIEHLKRVHFFRDLLKTDPQRAKAQLLQWEQFTIKHLKLEKFPN
jgi:hypothetical protein